MESVHTAYKNYVHMDRGDELFSIRGYLGSFTGNFLATMFQRMRGGMADVCDFKVSGEVIQPQKMGYL